MIKYTQTRKGIWMKEARFYYIKYFSVEKNTFGKIVHSPSWTYSYIKTGGGKEK